MYSEKELPWWDKTKPYYVKFIVPYGSGNVRIPKEYLNDKTCVRVMDGKKQLGKAVKFKDLPKQKP